MRISFVVAVAHVSLLHPSAMAGVTVSTAAMKSTAVSDEFAFQLHLQQVAVTWYR